MKSENIYDDLKRKIIWLELQPEKILNLSTLAEEYEVSRTPIKETLISLASEGWLLRHGNSFMVTPLSIARIRSISEVRFIIEPPAMELALNRLNPEEVGELEKLAKKIGSINNDSDNKLFITYDVEFHNLLYRATKNPQLTTYLSYMLDHYLRFWLSINERIDKSCFFDDTLQLIEAFVNQDKELVLQLSKHHVERSLKSIQSYFI